MPANNIYNIIDAPYLAIPGELSAAEHNAMAINLALSDAAITNGLVSIPGYTWYVSGTLYLQQRSHVRGDGRYSTWIVSTSNTAPIFWIIRAAEVVDGIVIEDLGLDRTPTPLAGANGIEIRSWQVNVGGCSLHNLYIKNQWHGVHMGPMNGGTVRHVTIERSYDDGFRCTGSNGQFLDLSILKSAGHGFHLLPDSGITDGGSFSNCTIWASGDSDFDGVPDNPDKDGFFFDLYDWLLSGVMLNGVTIDGAGRHGIHIRNASNASIFGGIVTGTNVASGDAIRIVRSNNALTMASITGVMIQGNYGRGLFVDARCGLTLTGNSFLLSGPNSTSIHFDNPANAEGYSIYSIVGNFLTRNGSGQCIIIEASAENIEQRTGVNGEGILSAVGNASNQEISEWISVKPSFTGELLIRANMRVGDSDAIDAQGPELKSLGMVSVEAKVVATPSVLDGFLIVNITGLGYRKIPVYFL